MSFSYVGLGATKTFSGTGEIQVTTPSGLILNDLLIVVFGFEAVAAGSSPYIDHTVEAGWSRLLTQAPSGSGSGLEVWWATWDTGTYTRFVPVASVTGVAREIAYRCPTGNQDVPGHTETTAQHTGDNPVCPSVTTTETDATIIGFVAHTLAGAPGFTWPAPYAEEIDNTRAGFTTVEISNSDATQAAIGASGTITTTATASPAGALGATGTAAFYCLSLRASQIYRRL